jgi:hypothetical protein
MLIDAPAPPIANETGVRRLEMARQLNGNSLIPQQPP